MLCSHGIVDFYLIEKNSLVLLWNVADIAEYTTKSTTTTTASPLSPCEQLRDASKHLLGNYVPRCTDNGDYDSLQCRGHPGTGTCWCADLSGREIPGTALSPPNTPDCEEGKDWLPGLWPGFAMCCVHCQLASLPWLGHMLCPLSPGFYGLA